MIEITRSLTVGAYIHTSEQSTSYERLKLLRVSVVGLIKKSLFQIGRESKG